MLLTNICVYTIKHSDDLRTALAKGGRDTYTARHSRNQTMMAFPIS